MAAPFVSPNYPGHDIVHFHGNPCTLILGHFVLSIYGLVAFADWLIRMHFPHRLRSKLKKSDCPISYRSTCQGVLWYETYTPRPHTEAQVDGDKMNIGTKT